MKTTTKHGIVTALGVVLFVLIGVATGDGYIDSWLDYLSIPSYCFSIVWLYARLNNFLNVEKWF